MSENIKLNQNNCTGCGACFAICPKNAIEKTVNEQGFFKFEINENLCINCKKCLLVCPALDFDFVNSEIVDCLACANKDAKEANNSSSGGVFALLAKKILHWNGVVFGAAFDENWKLRHVKVDNLNDLNKILKSKYIQSDLTGIYPQIKNLLNDGRKVLFAGTPCQCAGVKNYLSNLKVSIANLYLVDLLCHGVPSNGVFEQYLSEILPPDAIIQGIDFRNKKYSWQQFGLLIHYSLGNDNYEFFESLSDNLFLQGFIKNLYLRESCYSCKFASKSRVGDLTLGDFWGIETIDHTVNVGKGVSMVLGNSAKGRELFETIKNNLAFVKSYSIDNAVEHNPVLIRPCQKAEKSDCFWADIIQQRDTSEAIADNLGLPLAFPKSVGIMNFHYSNSNYGAILVPFALSEAVNKLGYKAKIIDYGYKYDRYHQVNLINDKNRAFENFRNEFLNLTTKCDSDNELRKINKEFSRLIVGSDQIWRSAWEYKYFFSWAFGKKTLIAYAASFSTDNCEYSEDERRIIPGLLARFDAVSVREKNGVEICKELGRHNAVNVLDPTMLLTTAEYQKIIDSDKDKSYLPQCEYIAYAFLDEDTVKYLLEDLTFKDVQKINLLFDSSGKNRSFGAWLNLIKNAKYVIADSFHCIVFAILYHKEFFCYHRDIGGNVRITNLLETFKISGDRFFYQWQDIHDLINSTKLDYAAIDNILAVKREYSMKFLQSALAIMPKEKIELNMVSEKTLVTGKKDFVLLKVIYNKSDIAVYLFDKILLYRTRTKSNRKLFELFKIIPLFKIQYRDDQKYLYLFRFLKIGKWNR